MTGQAAITNYKSLLRPLQGRMIDLVPLQAAHTPDVVRMRNQAHVRRFFDEKNPTTTESQNNFFSLYAARGNDLYWCMALKNGAVIGTDRLNEIDGASGHKGSMIVDEAWANRGPYALESGLLMLRFAFGVLKLRRVRAAIHPENEKAISFNQRLGFQRAGSCDLRGVLHEDYAITPEQFRPEQFDDLIDHFARRHNSL